MEIICRLEADFLVSFLNIKIGRKKKIPMTDIINPPMVPAAKGNQNASLFIATMNGINPRMVDIIVRAIGIIFAFHAFTYAESIERFG